MIVFANFFCTFLDAPGRTRVVGIVRHGPHLGAGHSECPADGQESGSFHIFNLRAGRCDSRAIGRIAFDGPQSCRNEVGRIADGVFPGSSAIRSPATATTSHTATERSEAPAMPARISRSGCSSAMIRAVAAAAAAMPTPAMRTGASGHAARSRGRLRFGRDEDQRSHFIRRISDRRRLPAHRP